MTYISIDQNTKYDEDWVQIDETVKSCFIQKYFQYNNFTKFYLNTHVNHLSWNLISQELPNKDKSLHILSCLRALSQSDCSISGGNQQYAGGVITLTQQSMLSGWVFICDCK